MKNIDEKEKEISIVIEMIKRSEHFIVVSKIDDNHTETYSTTRDHEENLLLLYPTVEIMMSEMEKEGKYKEVFDITEPSIYN